jgi:ketosteroid isomerase-like protein
MTPEEQRQLVDDHYSLNAAGDFAAARELLTDDFFITIPPHMPFSGVYRGKDAFRDLAPSVVEAVAVADMKFVATTVGDGCAVEIVEFTLAGYDGPPVQVAELIRFRDNKVCEIRPFYFDPAPMLDAASRRNRPASGSIRSQGQR